MAETISDALPKTGYTLPLGGFWRRLAAFLIDLVILGIIALILYFPLSAIFGEQIRIKGLYGKWDCRTGIPNKRDGTPFDVSKWTRVLICRHSAYRLIDSRYATFIKVEKAKIGIKRVVYGIHLDRRNNQVSAYYLDRWILLFFPLYLAVFEAGRNQRSKGKAIMSLKVENLHGEVISFGVAFTRNLIKFIPEIVAFSLSFLMYFLYPLPDLESVRQVPSFSLWFFVTSGGAFLALVIWFRVLPWFSSRNYRRLPHDRWTSTQVVEWWNTDSGTRK